MQINCNGQELDLSRSHVMGVLNVTPDSFSDGGRFNAPEAALERARQMLSLGASIIDVGGESTRPGAAHVSEQEELDRVCPIVERIVSELSCIVSVDTSTPVVMREVIRLGCGLINDVRAFERDGALEAVTGQEVGVCVMHMQGEPATMQHTPGYQNVVDEVLAYLLGRAERLRECGFERAQVILDPGFGFGKTLEHNLALLKAIDCFVETGHPVLAGLSRKSMIGAILDKPVDQRLYGSLAGAVIAAQKGARILRVHDVEAMVDALKVVDALSATNLEGV